MATAIMLLQLAIALLISAQQPGVPLEVRNHAIMVANQAINYAISVDNPSIPRATGSTPVDQVVEPKEQIKGNCTLESKVTYVLNGNNIESEVKWDSMGVNGSGVLYRSKVMGGSGGEYVPLYNGNITFEVYPIPKKHLLDLPTATTSLSYYPYFKLAYPNGTVCYAKSAPIQ